MKPAEPAEDAGGEEEKFEEFILGESFRLGKPNDADGGDEDAPENARGKDGAERISTPERCKR